MKHLPSRNVGPHPKHGPFALAFVYERGISSPYIVKGSVDAVTCSLEQTTCFCRFTVYGKHKDKLSYWWSPCLQIIRHTLFKEKGTHTVRHADKKLSVYARCDRTKEAVRLKRMPKKWIPEFDKLLGIAS